VCYRLHRKQASQARVEHRLNELFVVQRHSRSLLAPATAQREGLRRVYTELVSALAATGDVSRAREEFKNLAACQDNPLLTSWQRLVLTIRPSAFGTFTRRYSKLRKLFLPPE